MTHPILITRDDYVVKDRGFDTPCWIWQGGRNTTGHGQIHRYGGTFTAQRVAYEQWIGSIPPGYLVHHRCEQPPCINPEHLQAMTASEHRRLHYWKWQCNRS